MRNRDKPYLGELEKLILMAILGLGNNADATSIRKRLAEKAGRDLSVGAMYVTLDRMEEKGFIGAELGAATARTGNRQMKFFHIEGAGQQVLDDSERAREQMSEGIVWGWKLEGGMA